MSEAEMQEHEKNLRKRKALEMLIDNPESDDEFKPDTSDARFQEVFTNSKFSLDPTHKDFHKIKDGEYVKK